MCNVQSALQSVQPALHSVQLHAALLGDMQFGRWVCTLMHRGCYTALHCSEEQCSVQVVGVCSALHWVVHCNELYCSVEVVGVGRDQYFRSSACSSMPSPSILGRDDDHNDDDDDDDDDESTVGDKKCKVERGEVRKT